MDGKQDDIARLQKAYRIISRLEQENALLKQERAEPIAVTGLACRFPGGAITPADFWERLERGYDAAGVVPASRWDPDEFFDPTPMTPGKICTREGCFLDVDLDRFDAAFFGISPREANTLDPQQRLLLEVAWEAIESAGYPQQMLHGTKTGVFVGIGSSDFVELMARSAGLAAPDAYYKTGTTASVAAGRISHVLGLRGPCMAIDAACASGLVAAHLALRSLRAGESDIAIVGGVNLLLSPLGSIGLAQAGMLSPEGRCKAFDAAADGYVRGEGCGVLVLKRLRDARRDGDTIWAVLRGTAVNQCGTGDSLFTPSAAAQIEVIEAALEDAGICPAEVGYVEANGTGAPLSDVSEIAALGSVYGKGRGRSDTLAIGSVKTNIGHLEAAAGLAGIIKVIGILKRNLIPQHLHLGALNPDLDLQSIPASIPKQNVRWEPNNRPRRCAVHAFGFCGTNAHVIIEEAPESPAEEAATQSTDCEPPIQLVTLSVKNNRALGSMVDRFKAFCKTHDRIDLADLAYTTHTGRSHFARRVGVIVSSIDDLQRRLDARQFLEATAHLGTDPKVVFMFVGHGCHYIGMGRSLYDSQPVFQSAMQQVAELLNDRLAEPLLQVVFNVHGQGALLAQPRYHHAATFAIEYALAALWQSWGVIPKLVIGHGLGEYVASAWGGAISLADGLNLAIARGEIIESVQSRVRSLCLQTGPEEAERALHEFSKTNGQKIWFAAVSNPQEVICSCETAVYREWSLHLRRAGISITALDVPHVVPDLVSAESLTAFRKVAASVTAKACSVKLLSCGSPASRERCGFDESYWVHQLLAPIDFNHAIQRLLHQRYAVFIEIGPHHPITYAAHRFKREGEVLWLPSMCHGEEEWTVLLKSLGLLYVHGYDIDWQGYEEPYRARRKKAQLPFYPFDRQSYWPRAADHQQTATSHGKRSHPLLGIPVPGPRDDLDGLLYRPGWMPRPVDDAGVPIPVQDVVVFHHDAAVCDQWAANLRNEGRRVIQADSHGVNMTDEAQLTAWLAALPDKGHAVSHLVFVCRDPLTRGDDLAGQFKDCREVFTLIHSAFKAAWPQLPYLMIVTADACTYRTGAVSLEQAPLNGLLGSLALERPELMLSQIDFTTVTSIAQRADVITREMTKKPTGTQVAFRNNQYFVPVLRSCQSTDPPVQMVGDDVDGQPDGTAPGSADGKQQTRSQESLRRGLLVVTGGAGRFGASIARGLFEHGFNHFVLLDDQPLCPEARAIVEEIEARGARIKSATIEWSDYEQTFDFLERLCAEHPPVVGIIHAAGCEREAYLLQEDWDAVEAVFDRKVRSAWNLHQATQALQLDLACFVCFSSIAALNGLPEKGVEAAADAFLDALVWQRRQLQLAAQTINWSGWVDPDALLRRTAYTIAGIHAIPVEVGVEALLRVMEGGHPQVVVADANWSIYQGIFPHAADWCRGLDAPQPAFQGSDFKSRILAADAKTALEMIQEEVRRVVRSVLELPPQRSIGEREDFQALGIDSLMGVQMLAMLKHTFADLFVLKNVALLELATVEKLAWYILREIHKIVEWDDPLMDQRPSSGIFTLSSSGSEPPLFVLSGLDGLAISFFALAQSLSKNRPIYVLQDPQLTDGIQFETVEELAGHQIAQIQSVQPHGPYLLLGWSMGGAVAYEMAKQLEARGEMVAFACILEGAAWERSDNTEEYQLRDLLKMILLELLASPDEIDNLLGGESFALDREEAVLARIAEFIGRHRLLPEDHDVLDGLHYGRCLLQNVKLLMRYQLTGNIRQMTIVEAEMNLASMLGESSSHLSLTGWADHSREPAITARVPGNHLTIMQKPNVQALGKRLSRLLEQVTSSHYEAGIVPP